MNAVEVRHLHVRYDRVEALQGVDFDVPRGTALGIVGPNGSGKSTLLKAVAGLLKPSEGTVRVQGRPPRALPPGTIGYVPQIEDVDWQFPVTVRDVVAMGRYPRLGPFRVFSAHDRSAVARAIAQEPLLLLLDEPTTGVDAATEESLLHLVRGLVADGLPVLMTTHDLDRAPEWFDRLIVVDRRILADGTPTDVLESGAYAGIREHTHTHGHRRDGV